MSEVNMGTLYDMNKSAVLAGGALNKAKTKAGLNLIEQYFKDTDNTYYMLLCHEQRDYTIFRITDISSIPEAVVAAKECFDNRGQLFSIDKDKNGAIEIWLRIEEEMFCYYLFPYDDAIIEV